MTNHRLINVGKAKPHTFL